MALADDEHVEVQLARYAERRALWTAWLEASDLVHDGGPGTFYLWVRARHDGVDRGDGGDPHAAAWALAARFARGGTLVAPGDLYGERRARHVRIALVQPLERLQLALERLAPVPAA